MDIEAGEIWGAGQGRELVRQAVELTEFKGLNSTWLICLNPLGCQGQRDDLRCVGSCLGTQKQTRSLPSLPPLPRAQRFHGLAGSKHPRGCVRGSGFRQQMDRHEWLADYRRKGQKARPG